MESLQIVRAGTLPSVKSSSSREIPPEVPQRQRETEIIGICLVYSGISDLVTTYYMGRAKRRIKNVIQTEINQQKILHDDNVIDVDEDELH